MKDHQLAAIVFTDIVGYTKRMEADEEGTMKLLARQREIIFPMVKEFGGEVIKEIGDGLMMMFTSANRAVRFAMAVQEKLKNEELTIRAGIHIGDVIFEEGDVFGSAVNIAARIEPLAPAGGICISEDVRSQIRNQSDIITSSLGKKELKGVKQAIEIYQIVHEETGISQKKISFFTDLWQRRVIQIIGLYLIFAFLIRLGMDFVTKEYMLSPHLSNLVWYILISLIPSIILVSYFHGKRGISRWTKVELIGMPLNIIAAALVLIFVFKGKDLGAITTTLTAHNEDGEKIEKVVVKNEFRKKVLIFNMENVSGDAELDPLQYGIPAMAKYDLSQDLLLTPESIMDLPGVFTKLKEAGYENAVGLPVTLMKQYAENVHMNYFIFGEINRSNDEYTLDAQLFDTKLTRLVAEISVTDPTPFGLVDQLSVEMKKAMGITDFHLEETVDLPLSEIFTDSENALFLFSSSIFERSLNNWAGNVHLLNLAIQEDHDFALAYVSVTLAYLNLGDMENAKTALQKGIELLYKLPERQQFVLKYVNYVLGQEPEKALAVVKMWVEFYPDDLMGHMTLAERYAVKNMFPEAIKEYKNILRLDPEQYQVLSTLGGIYLQSGNFDSSLLYYEKYAHFSPQQAKSYRDLGNYYILAGDLEKAKESFEKALLLADFTDLVPIKVDLANILLKTGNFDLAYKEYQDALAVARSARDTSSVLNALERFYITKGQTKKSVEIYEQKIQRIKSFLPPKDIMVYQILHIDAYINAGEFDLAFGVLDEIKGKLEPPLDNLVPFGYMMLYAEMGDSVKAMEAFSGAEDLAKGFGEEVLMSNIYYAQGRLKESLGRYQEAIDNYTKYLQIQPTSYFVHMNIARCYRQLNDYDNAKKEIQISLKYRPFEPLRNFEAAIIYLDSGEKEKGMEYLNRAVDIWKDADPDYEKASLARDKLNELL